MTSGATTHARPLRWLQVAYLVITVAAPCVGLLWFTTSELWGGDALIPSAARVLLWFVSIPIYVVYIGIHIFRFFPTELGRALSWLVPFVINGALSLWLYRTDSV